MKLGRYSHLLWPLVALAVLLLVNLIWGQGFFSVVYKDGRFYGSLIDILDRSVPLILVSLGMTLVIATAGVDLSVGAVTAVAGAVAAVSLQSGSLPFAVAVALALGLSFLLGAWNGGLVVGLGLQPIVATLILMVAGRGVAQLLTDGQIVAISHPAYAFLGSGAIAGLPFGIVMAVGVFALIAGLCRWTALGLFIESLGNSPSASRAVGINTPIIKGATYAVSGLLAGLAGLVVSSDIRAIDVNNAGLYLELDAILAVVVGGTKLTGGRFTLLGSALGALVIQTVSTTINTRGVPVELMLMVKAIVIISVCLLQSKRVSEKWRWKRDKSQGLPMAPEKAAV